MYRFDSARSKTKPQSDLAAAFLELVPRAMREIRREIRSHRASSLTLPQFRVLANLIHGAKSNKELAEDIGVNVATMSRMVQHLTGKSLIETSANGNDLREKSIQLSVQGRAILEKLRAQAREGLAVKLASRLTALDRKTLLNGLKILEKALD